MNETPATPPSAEPLTKPQRRRDYSKLFVGGLVLGAVLLATGYFYLLMQGPKEKPVMEVARAEVRPAGSTILGVPAPAPAPRQAETAPKPEVKTTLTEIAKVEAARQAKPDGPLYDPKSSDVALSFEGIRVDDPQVAEAQAVLARYLQAGTWRERLPFVFEPERVETLMQEWQEKRGEKEPEHGRLLGAGILTAGSSQVLNLQFACMTRPDAGLRANFHRTHAGKLLLDWESWVAWSEVSWAEFKRERSQREVVMRAVASESSYYNYEFGESWRWLAVKLRSPDGLHSVTGYVERKTALGVALANLIGVPLPHQLTDDAPLPALKLPGSKALVTVRLAFPNQAQSDHCVKIKGMLADRWLLFPGERGE